MIVNKADKKTQGPANPRRFSQKQAERKKSITLFVILVFTFTFLILYYKGIKVWEISPGKSVIRFLAILFLLFLAFQVLSHIAFFSAKLRKKPEGEATMLAGFMRTLTGLAILLALIESMGKITAFGAIGAGFAGMLLGWSLQAPVSGMAAWVLVMIRRPFRVGDRITFPSLALVGDVTDIGAMYTVLNQVGGTVGSEDATGRYILIPNAMLFSQVAINYTSRQESTYVLDEVILRMTYDSDWDVAEKILLGVAKEVTAYIIKETGTEPYIRSDMYDYGIYVRLRYMTEARERPKISHEINKRIFREFQRNPKVDFAIPFVYSARAGEKDKDRSVISEEHQMRP